MRFLTALTTACLLLINGVTAIDNSVAASPASAVSPMLTRLVETIQSVTTEQKQETIQSNAVQTTTNHDTKQEQSQSLSLTPVDTNIVVTPINPILLLLPDLVGTLTISDSSYPYVYPPNSIGIQNVGNAASLPFTAKLSCVAWTTYPAQIIPNGVVTGPDGKPYGVCFSDMPFQVPSIPAGGWWYPNLPFTLGPIACRKPAGMCDVHWTVDTTNANTEWSKSNNNVVITKTTVASNPPYWP